MSIRKGRYFKLVYQYLLSFLLVLTISFIAYLFDDVIGYRIIAFILLLCVSILAMIFDILPVLLTALLSALLWNFYFIPPKFTFHIGNPEDGLLFLMYFVIATINAVLTFKIKEFERKARDKEESEKSIKLYNTLLNSLSHELRTPIATIIGSIDTIREHSNQLSEQNTNQLYIEIEQASLRLNDQVENLLNMSRLDSGLLKPKLDWTDLNEVVYKAIQLNKEKSAPHQVEFDPKADLPLYKTDQFFIEQIIHNLLKNAMTYTPENSTIKIKLDQSENGFILNFSDNGPGFPKAEEKNVFDKFYRLSNSKAGGTGLGLSIVKGFSEALAGKVELSKMDTSMGAHFIITIPCESISSNNLEHE